MEHIILMVKLGQKLHEQRLKLGLTLDDVTKVTKIRPAFLSAIEHGEYNKLPASAYARGFVVNYAEYLGLSRREALALFRREFDDAKTVTVLPDKFAEPSTSSFFSIKVQYATFAALVAFIVLVFYLGYSYKDMFINPSLAVAEPRATVVNSGEVIVRGKANPYDTVTVNNAPVYVENDGTFIKTLFVFPGKTKISVKTVNRFGRSTTIEKLVDFKK